MKPENNFCLRKNVVMKTEDCIEDYFTGLSRRAMDTKKLL